MNWEQGLDIQRRFFAMAEVIGSWKKAMAWALEIERQWNHEKKLTQSNKKDWFQMKIITGNINWMRSNKSLRKRFKFLTSLRLHEIRKQIQTRICHDIHSSIHHQTYGMVWGHISWTVLASCDCFCVHYCNLSHTARVKRDHRGSTWRGMQTLHDNNQSVKDSW